MSLKLFMFFAMAVGFAGVTAARPAPPAPVVTPNERSVAFWVKFDRLPSVGEPTGLLGCRADASGRLLITWKALPTEIAGDLVMTSSETVRAGEWHHVEANYSLMRQRATLYLDGRFQWENDNLNVPRLVDLRSEAPSDDFAGAVRNPRRWDSAVESERMAVVSREESARRLGAVRTDLAAARKSGARSTGLAAWLMALSARADAFAADDPDFPTVTLAELKALARDAAHARHLASEAASGKKGLHDGAAVYAVPPLSQDPVLPYGLPANGVLTDRLRLFACPGEYEACSFALVALDALSVEKAVVFDLRGESAAIPASAVDLKLVKRWYRSGSAWISYHNDRRFRVLTPDLLVNDDSLVYVDEEQSRNYLRLDYPEGSVYTDVSDPALNHFAWEAQVPFKDAATLQPFAIDEPGRNQQLLATVHVPSDAKPGLYEGKVTLTTDRGSVEIALAVKVLPIELPLQPSPYRDPSRSYITHLNSFPVVEGVTEAERLAYIRFFMHDLHAHNMNHVTGLWNFPSLAKAAYEEGFVPDRIFMHRGKPSLWWSFFPGIDRGDLTLKDREAGLKACERALWDNLRYLKENFPEWSKHYVISFSESTDFGSLSRRQGEIADVARAVGKRTFAHGMGHWNSQWAGDIQDMNSSTLISSEEASRWHAAGGELINYANPFPSAENPYWYRRKQGVQMYRVGLDGHMMHGYRAGRVAWNEWAEDWGGDGNYRNFCNGFPMRGGAVMKLCWEGTREGYDDLRYLTRLTQLAQANLDSSDPDLLREAKRAMLWIEKIDPLLTDLDMLRAGTAERILVLQDAIARHGGALPAANPPRKGGER